MQIRDFESDDHTTYVSREYNLRYVESHDVLLAHYGASVGKILTGRSGAINVALVKTVPDTERLLKPFLYYFMQVSEVQRFLLSLGGRSAQAGFNKGELDRIRLPLPPVTEQSEIAGVLQICDAKVAALEREAALLDELFRAMLEELMSGRLSAAPLIAGQDNDG